MNMSLSNLYMAEMNAYYASIAQEIENRCYEARLRAAYDALDHLIGGKESPASVIDASANPGQLKRLDSTLLVAHP